MYFCIARQFGGMDPFSSFQALNDKKEGAATVQF
jgi:hypothetical protein